MKPLFAITFLQIFHIGYGFRNSTAECVLAKELYAAGIPKNQLNDWVCLAKAESGFDREYEQGPYTDGSKDFGIFGINSYNWCKTWRRGGECKINCHKFLDDDLQDDIECALTIYDTVGFAGWHNWKIKCQNRISDVTECDLGGARTVNQKPEKDDASETN